MAPRTTTPLAVDALLLSENQADGDAVMVATILSCLACMARRNDLLHNFAEAVKPADGVIIRGPATSTATSLLTRPGTDYNSAGPSFAFRSGTLVERRTHLSG